MDRRRIESRTPTPIFAIKKPRMAVFAQPSDLSLVENQKQSLPDFKPRHLSTSTLQSQMNSVSYRPLQTQTKQSLTPTYQTGKAQSFVKPGQQFEPQGQASPSCGQASLRMPLFQRRQNVSSFQPQSAAGGKYPLQRYPPFTKGPQFPLHTPARLNPLPPMESQDYNSRSDFPGGYDHRNKSAQVKGVTDAQSSTSLEEDVVAPMFAVEKNTLDRSLRVMTTSISGMKHWTTLKDKPLLLFEVFGTVNSAVSGDSTTDAIQFLLKDNQAAVNCIFYQIDRTLPRLVRGQWYRCIGRCNPNSGSCFQCVSIRPITEGEKKHMKLLLAASDKATQALAQKTHEI